MKVPCLTCGRPCKGPRCAAHTVVRERHRGHRAYNSQAWRRASAQARDEQPYCARCGSPWDLTADHVVPLALGGPAVPEPEGIVVLCRRCNSNKGGRLPGSAPR